MQLKLLSGEEDLFGEVVEVVVLVEEVPSFDKALLAEAPFEMFVLAEAVASIAEASLALVDGPRKWMFPGWEMRMARCMIELGPFEAHFVFRYLWKAENVLNSCCVRWVDVHFAAL